MQSIHSLGTIKFSFYLNYTHFFFRIKLVVTETFDAGLFGEHVIPSMISVHSNILNENGIVIPMGATLYVAAVECEYIKHKSTVMFDKIKLFCPLNFDNVTVLLDEEYYDTENLKNVQVNYITDPTALLSINFNSLAELQQFNIDGIKNTIKVDCKCNGTIDGLITWFKLHLDEEITIDTSEKKSCWQVAVFPTVPKLLNEGDIVLIKGEMVKGKLKCSYTRPGTPPNDQDDKKIVCRLPKEVVTFLNDFEYIRLLTEVSKSLVKKEIHSILDTSPFPIYGLMLLKENKHGRILYYKSKNSSFHSFIRLIADQNCLSNKLCIVSEYIHIKDSLDTVFIHDFDMKGELKDCSEEDNHEFFR